MSETEYRIYRSPCGKIELRLGRWQDVLADVDSCGAIITDPPYSADTHGGLSSMEQFSGRRNVQYNCIGARDVREFVRRWSDLCSSWVAVMTDDRLAYLWRTTMDKSGRHAFASVPIIQDRVRLGGDGPASCAVYLIVSRPLSREYSHWGSLPGYYHAGMVRGAPIIGAKPLGLMERIVDHYSRHGDLVVDPYAGSGTTLLAAASLGRSAIGAEADPKTFAYAVKRLSAGYTPIFAFGSKQKPKQEGLL